MNIFDIIAENKLKEAMRAGQLDQPALYGRPIDIDDDFSIPAMRRFQIRHLKAMAKSRREPSPLVARWKAMQYRNHLCRTAIKLWTTGE